MNHSARWLNFIIVVLLFHFTLSVSANSLSTTNLSPALYLSFEQRWVVSYILLGIGEPPDIQEKISERFFNQVKDILSKKRQIVHVNSYDDFLTHYRGAWPNSYSVESDLDLIEREGLRAIPIYKAANKDLQEKIEQFYSERDKLIISSIEPQTAGQFIKLTQSLRFQRSIEFPNFEKILTQNFKDILSAEKKFIETNGGQDNSIKIVISLVIEEYFQQLGLKSQKQIVNQFLGGNLNSTAIEKFEIMVMNSGPQFQKLLQIIAREKGYDDQMGDIFKKLESSIRSVPKALVDDLIKPEVTNYSIYSYDSDPLAVGTMAQVHLGYLQSQNKIPVVIRFLKPGIRERVDEDYKILKQMAPRIDENSIVKKLGIPKLAPIIEDLTQTIRDELESKNTVDRQIRGQQVYTKTIKTKISNGQKIDITISVPDIILANNPNTQIMVQTFAEGDSLEKTYSEWQEKIPELKKIIAENLATVWLEELILKGGFYHSDLHQGNFKINMNKVSENKINIPILDFGMGGEISLVQRRSLLLVAAGTEIFDAKMVGEALWILSNPTANTIVRKDFEQEVENKIHDIRHRNIFLSADHWLAWATNYGLKFSPEVIGVSRGFVILDRLLEQSGSHLNMLSLGRQIVMKNKLKTIVDLRATGKVSFVDLMRLWLASFKKTKQADNYIPICREVFL